MTHTGTDKPLRYDHGYDARPTHEGAEYGHVQANSSGRADGEEGAAGNKKKKKRRKGKSAGDKKKDCKRQQRNRGG